MLEDVEAIQEQLRAAAEVRDSHSERMVGLSGHWPETQFCVLNAFVPS
jgi:hypothetical protein